MRVIQWTDDDGYKRRRWVKDDDPDELGMLGIPEESPNLSELDWEDVARTLHNQLMDRHLYTFEDVQRSQTGITASVRAALVKPLIKLYRGGT